MEYRQFAGNADTPDAFGAGGAAGPIILGGAPPTVNPVMFTSEGSFTDANGNPINASVFIGVANQRNTSNAVTIIGTTATVRTWRFMARLPVDGCSDDDPAGDREHRLTTPVSPARTASP